MCEAMNRSFISVIAGGSASNADQRRRLLRRAPRDHAEGAAELLKSAKSVIITPGYGMAVAAGTGTASPT